jgi:hypothetical protein
MHLKSVPHNHLHVIILQVPFSRTVYIEKTDFRLKDSKDYYGLAPGKSALLRCHFFHRDSLFGFICTPVLT